MPLPSPVPVEYVLPGPVAIVEDEPMMQIRLRAILSTLGCFFIALRSMRRTETAYGWFGLMCLAWRLWALNQIMTSTWPFSSNDMLESADAVIFHA